MAITRAQQILVKRAQREAGLGDAEYREVLCSVSGCRSTTDPRMTDRHMDMVLAYMEAICWCRVDAGELQGPRSASAVFRQRGYWASKNPRGNTSRDRYNAPDLEREIASLESALGALGFGSAYCAGIRSRAANGRTGTYALQIYKAALCRTLDAKQRALAAAAVG